jgi:putative oxidoreductase
MLYPTTSEVTRGSGKGTIVALWAMQIVAAAAFVAAGGAKLSGAAPMVAIYEQIGIGQWFRYLTGILEVAGAIALLLPRFTFYGAALLATVMFGAILAHLTVLGVLSAMPAFALLLLTGTIAFLRRSR